MTQKNELENTKQRPNPLFSKIDKLMLGEIIREKYNEGKSQLTITEELNEEVLKNSGESVSAMAVNRWIRKNLSTEDEETEAENTVNIYRQNEQLLKTVNAQMDILDTYLESLQKNIKNNVDVLSMSKSINSFMGTYDKLMNRKATLLSNIGALQEKVFNFQAASDIANITLDAVKNKDKQLYDDIVAELQADPKLTLSYQRIKN